MSFFDWTHVSGAAIGDAPTYGLDSGIDHIEQLKSLLYQTAPANNPSGAYVISGRDIGAEFSVSGNDVKVQTMFRNINGNGTPLVFLQMATSIDPTNTCYFLNWDKTPTVALYKSTVATLASGAPPTPIATMSGPPSAANGSIYALAIQCHYDTNSGTMFLVGSIDSNPIASPNTYDFSTLSEVITYSDTSTPYSNEARAGIGMVFVAGNGGPGTNTKLMDLDVTQIFTP